MFFVQNSLSGGAWVKGHAQEAKSVCLSGHELPELRGHNEKMAVYYLKGISGQNLHILFPPISQAQFAPRIIAQGLSELGAGLREH